MSRTTRRLSGFGATASTSASISAGVLWTRREEHVRARRGVRLQTSVRFAEGIGMADVVTLGSRGQQHVLAGSIDRLSRGADALDRDWQIVERRRRITSGVLDRQARNARCDAPSDALGHVLRLQSIPGHEVRAHRKIDCSRDACDVSKVPIAS